MKLLMASIPMKILVNFILKSLNPINVIAVWYSFIDWINVLGHLPAFL